MRVRFTLPIALISLLLLGFALPMRFLEVVEEVVLFDIDVFAMCKKTEEVKIRNNFGSPIRMEDIYGKNGKGI